MILSLHALNSLDKRLASRVCTICAHFLWPCRARRSDLLAPEMPEVDVLKISNEDAAFVLGKNGKTKEKIARVSGADLDLYEHSLTLEIRGSDDERKRAKKCAPWPICTHRSLKAATGPRPSGGSIRQAKIG